MKVKHALILLIAGFCIDFVGALFKIMHWLYADALFITGAILKVFGSLLLLYKLLTHPKIKEFVNW